NAILHDEPTQFLKKFADIPPELRQICQKMLLKNPDHRYQDCQELIQDLEALQITYKFTLSYNNLKTYLETPKDYESKIFSSKVLKALVNKQTKLKNYIFIVSFFTLMLILGYYGLFFNKSQRNSGNEIFQKPQINSNQELVSTVKESLSLNPLEKQKIPFDKTAGSLINNKKSKVPPQEEKLIDQDNPKLSSESDVLDESHQESNSKDLGYLTISCMPWAQVFIDGDSIGTTPFENSIPLTVGRHEIVMKNTEFPEYKEWIEIKNDENANIELSLWSMVGTLKLKVSPWAEVYVDGEYKDTVPPQDRPFILFPGRHTLLLKHPVLGEWQTPIEISAGQSLELKFNLKNLIAQ
ncbi:MAG: PEGA domain-containing protein, partial [bacterium]